MNSHPKSVAILGGSFDPVHLGHMSLAEEAYAELDLDDVWFIPTAQTPLKHNEIVLSADRRVELLEAALAPFTFFKLNKSEIELGGMSFTIDTMRRFKTGYPDTSFYWIIGGDQVEQLNKWKNIEELCWLMQFIIISRPGYKIDTKKIPDIPGLRFSEVKSRWLAIASSDIRDRIAAGKPVNHLLPKAVVDLIVQRKFYTD